MVAVLNKIQDGCKILLANIKRRISQTRDNLHNPDHPFWLFVSLLILAVIFFSLVLINNLFTIPLSGDYVLQQIPFYTNGYDDWWKFLKTGEFPLWDYSTFLGANNIGANSFYYVLNPFFLPVLLFPRDLVPQGLAVMMMLKMALAGMSFYALLRYHKVSIRTAKMIAIAYAFCGWNIYYLWFNHFLEVCVMFPIILLGIDKIIKEKKPWLLIFALFIMGLCNYFFLVSSCFCGVLYAGYRYFQTLNKRNVKNNFLVLGIGIAGFAVGLMMASLVLLPIINIVVNTPRVEDATYLDRLLEYIKILRESYSKENFDILWKHLTEWQPPKGSADLSYKKKAWYPLASFFFPSVSGFNNTLFPNSGYDNTLSSIFIYTPLMLFLIPSIINSLRNKKWSVLVAISFLLIALFTPFFYYLCYGFTLDYGRWQLFVITSMLLLIAKNYEERNKMKGWYFDLSFAICFTLAIIVVKVALDMQKSQAAYSLRDLEERIYVIYGQLAYIFIVYIFLRTQYKKDKLTTWLTTLLSLEAIVMGNLTFSFQTPAKYSELSGGLSNIREEEKIVRALQSQDKGFYRIYNTSADRGSNNLAMREGYKGVGAFHSLYNFNTQDFLHWSQVNYSRNNWSMGVHEKRYNLDTFLNIKYYITQFNNKSRDYNIPFGYREITNELGIQVKDHRVFINENFSELGFSYDNIIPHYAATSLRDDWGDPILDEDGVRQYTYNKTENLINNAATYTPINVDQNEVAYLTGGIIHNDYLKDVLAEAPELDVLEGKFFAPTIKQQAQTVMLQKLSDEEIAELMENGDSVPAPEIVTGWISSSSYKYKSTMTITPSDGKPICPTATAENGCYLSVRARLGENAWIYLYDLDSGIANGDKHMYHGYNVGSDYKYARGFYTNVPLSKIIITVFTNQGYSLAYPQVFTEQYNDFLARFNRVSNTLENVAYTDNTIQFTTNYNQKRFIVLSVPYEKGWSVNRITKNSSTGKTVKEPAKVYVAQGGFLGFVSGLGDTQYELSFYPPQLNEGLALFASGTLIFVSSWGAAYYVERKRKKKLEVEEQKQ